MTILVLDDDEAMVRTLRRGFEQLKHLVFCALTADEAVELALRATHAGYVDAVEQHRKLGGVHLHSTTIAGYAWHPKAPALQALVTCYRMQPLLSQRYA